MYYVLEITYFVLIATYYSKYIQCVVYTEYSCHSKDTQPFCQKSDIPEYIKVNDYGIRWNA